MKLIQLNFVLDDNLILKEIVFNYNDSGMKSNSELLRNLSLTLLNALAKEKESVELQDTLNDLGISRPDREETDNAGKS